MFAQIFGISIMALFSPILVSPQHIPNPTKTQSFLTSLINDQLTHCTLLFFQDRDDHSETVDYIIQNTNLNYFSVKYTYPTNTEILKFMETVHAFNLNQDNVTTALSSTTTLPLHFPITVSNYHKRTDPCVLAILMINDLRPEFIKQVFNLLTPVYIPITRKDEDFYVFVTKPYNMRKLLQMRELPGRVKFKISVGEQTNKGDKGKLVVRTVCFFCGPHGSPVVVDYPEDYTPGFNYFPDFIHDLNGKLLHIACPFIRARIETDPPYEGVSNARRGLWKNMFEEYLTVRFNFTYNIFVATGKDGNKGGGGTGVQLPNGTWIGVTGDLVSGKADLGIVTANTPKRIKFIDFTNSFFDFGYLTYVTSEGSRVYSPLALLWPFDILMWFCIFLSTIVAFIFFTFIIRAIFWLNIGGGDSLSFARRGMVSNDVWSFKYQIQFIMTSFLDQDCVLPTFSPLRCFVAIWLFFTLVLTTIYRSKLVTLLAFPVIEKLPQNFDDLAYSKYTVGFMKHGDSAYNTLAASTDPVYVKLVKEMEVDVGVGTACLNKVVTEKYGCIAYNFALTHLSERNLSDSDTRKLVFAPAHTYNIYLGLATEGKSIYRLNFGRWLSRIRAAHLNDVWETKDMYYTVRLLKRDWWFKTNQSEKASKTSTDEGGDDNLTLKHISGAFYVLAGLMLLSLIIFWIELVKFNWVKISERLEFVRKTIWKGLRRFVMIKKFKKIREENLHLSHMEM